jgi:hypothetical protein
MSGFPRRGFRPIRALRPRGPRPGPLGPALSRDRALRAIPEVAVLGRPAAGVVAIALGDLMRRLSGK